MKSLRAGSRAAIAALLLSGVGGAAHAVTPQAQAPAPTPNSFVGSAAAAAPRKSLQWDASGQWTLNLDMDQPVGREMDWKDVSAGAYFHITPSMRIGGSVGIGDKLAAPAEKIIPQDTSTAPRVHLETKFKF